LLKNTGSMLYGASCCAYDDQRITSRTFLKPASPIFLKYSGFMGGSGTVSPLRSNTPGMLMPRPSLRFCSKGSVPGAALVCSGNRAIKVSTMGKHLIQILGKRLCGRCQPGYLCRGRGHRRSPVREPAATPGLQVGRATHGSAGDAPGNGGNDLAPTPSVSFFFLGRVTGTRCSCCRGAGPSRVCWRSWSGSGDSATTGRTPDWLDFRRPGRTGTKTRHGVSWWTRQGVGSFYFRREKDHGAQRSGPRLWKRSFCASTQDRNKTVSCRCRLRLARAPASGQVRNLRRSRPGRWRPPTHGGRHGGAVKAPGNGSNGSVQTPSVFFLFWERAAETRCSCCQGLLSVCWRSEGSVGNPARPRVV